MNQENIIKLINSYVHLIEWRKKSTTRFELLGS